MWDTFVLASRSGPSKELGQQPLRSKPKPIIADPELRFCGSTFKDARSLTVSLCSLSRLSCTCVLNE